MRSNYIGDDSQNNGSLTITSVPDIQLLEHNKVTRGVKGNCDLMSKYGSLLYYL